MAGEPQAEPIDISAIAGWTRQLEQQLPKSAANFSSKQVATVRKTADSIDRWAAQLSLAQYSATTDQSLKISEAILTAKTEVDRLLEQTFSLRGSFAGLPSGKQQAARLAFLQTTSKLIDLSGRLRYTLYDTLMDAALISSADSRVRSQLIDLLVKHRSSIGAAIYLPMISDQFALEHVQPPLSKPEKLKLLELAASSHQSELLAPLVELLRLEELPPELQLQTAVTIYYIGVPQPPRPEQSPELPEPEITPEQLYEIVMAISPTKLDSAQAQLRKELLDQLAIRTKQGIAADSYRFGGIEVQPGDWLLMRNPSPYNLFTDLSPGLFTHVGMVALETGSDGLRRMVVVDLPEHGTHMGVTNVDLFVQRTLHYMFVRHPDPKTARKLGDVAAETIGMQTEFDLNFRTDRLQELTSAPLKEQTLHTYCAGLLLLSVQRSGANHRDFFPFDESPASGNTVANLEKINITFGDNFVSPTGPIFSPQLKIVGQREPMYDPRREVEEAIFDHFAQSLKTKTLTPSPNLYQSLRAKVAAAAELSPPLAAALARAANAPKQTDLAAAAHAAAVIETLDEIAFGAGGQFLQARQAVLTESEDPTDNKTVDAETLEPATSEEQASAAANDVATPETPQPEASDAEAPNAETSDTEASAQQLAELRQRHAQLIQRWNSGELTPRALRVSLVNYYIAQGKQQLDQRFFTTSDSSPASSAEQPIAD